MQQMIFIADLIACSTCFGHYYTVGCSRSCLLWFSSCWYGEELRAPNKNHLLHPVAFYFHILTTIQVKITSNVN